MTRGSSGMKRISIDGVASAICRSSCLKVPKPGGTFCSELGSPCARTSAGAADRAASKQDYGRLVHRASSGVWADGIRYTRSNLFRAGQRRRADGGRYALAQLGDPHFIHAAHRLQAFRGEAQRPGDRARPAVAAVAGPACRPWSAPPGPDGCSRRAGPGRRDRPLMGRAGCPAARRRRPAAPACPGSPRSASGSRPDCPCWPGQSRSPAGRPGRRSGSRKRFMCCVLPGVPLTRARPFRPGQRIQEARLADVRSPDEGDFREDWVELSEWIGKGTDELDGKIGETELEGGSSRLPSSASPAR